MHLLSFVQWNHFAYMVISVAMLGFGTSGTLISLAKKWLTKNIEIKLFLLMILTGISMAGINIISSFIFTKFDSFLLFIDKSKLLYLFLVYFILFIPFFFGATAIGLSYLVYVNKISFLYFADLFGSGIGGLAMLGLFWIFYPDALLPLIAIFPILASILIIPQNHFKKYIIPVLIIFLFPVYLVIKPFPIPVSEYKSIAKTLNLPETNIICEKKSPYGQIQLVRSNTIRYAPGLSFNFTGDIPVRDVVFCNGNWFGPVINWSDGDSLHFMDYTTQNLPFLVFSGGNILILESGTGLDATHALSHKPDKITLIEQNTVVLDILHKYSDTRKNSFLLNPLLKVVTKNPRSFLLSDTAFYDLIILPVIESFGGNSGINALKEQYIYTLDAFQEIYNRLSPEGTLAITTWIDYPLRNPLKILSTLIELLNINNETQVSKQIAAIRSWGTITYVLKKSFLKDEELNKIRDFCEEMYFDPLLLPGISPEEKIVFNHLEDTSLINYVDRILSDDRVNFYKDYDFRINPSTDNRPYFSQFLKLKRLNKLHDLFGAASVPYVELGYIIVLFTFIQISIVALVFIILPLFFTIWQGEKKLYTLLHFGGIGVGFMFVEIIFIQQFTLYFGHPIYSASAVLSGMLLCSGIGSFISSKLDIKKINISLILLLIIICLLSYAFILAPLIKASMNLPFAVKVLVSILIIGFPAFFMGMPFPLGLKYLEKNNKNMLSWAWGVNGCMSVISTVLASIIAVEAGFLLVMIMAGFFYTCTLIANLIR